MYASANSEKGRRSSSAVAGIAAPRRRTQPAEAVAGKNDTAALLHYRRRGGRHPAAGAREPLKDVRLRGRRPGEARSRPHCRQVRRRRPHRCSLLLPQSVFKIQKRALDAGGGGGISPADDQVVLGKHLLEAYLMDILLSSLCDFVLLFISLIAVVNISFVSCCGSCVFFFSIIPFMFLMFSAPFLALFFL